MTSFYISCDCNESYKVHFDKHRIINVEVKQTEDKCKVIFNVVPFPKYIQILSSPKQLEYNS